MISQLRVHCQRARGRGRKRDDRAHHTPSALGRADRTRELCASDALLVVTETSRPRRRCGDSCESMRGSALRRLATLPATPSPRLAPAARKSRRPRAREHVDAITRREARRRTGAQVGIAGASFLAAFTLLHLLHAAGADPAPVRAISIIPLFALTLASAAIAVPLGLVAGGLCRDRRRLLQRLPAAMALGIIVFAAVVILLP